MVNCRLLWFSAHKVNHFDMISYLLERLILTLKANSHIVISSSQQMIVVDANGQVSYNNLISKLPSFMSEWLFSSEMTKYKSVC